MRKFLGLIIILLILTGSTLAASAYTVNPFYAIDSASEYGKVNGILNGNNNYIYFQWGRLARNTEGIIQFTNKMSFGISRYDSRSEYGVPYKLDVPETEYTVQPDDSLSAIAGKYEIQYKMLGEYNGITDISKIQVGQKIKIPTKSYDTSSKDDYKQRYPDGKALLSVYFDAIEYSDKRNSEIEFLNMDESSWMENIIKPVMDMVDSMEFDGIVLDFEGFRDSFTNMNYSVSQQTGLKEKYNKFLSCLKKSLKNKVLTVVVHPTNVAGYFDGYDLTGIGKTADYMILMAYDFQNFQKYGVNDKVPAVLFGKIKSINPSTLNQPYVQPYDKVDESVKNLLQSGVAPEKVLLGINLAGVKWIKYKKNIGGEMYYYYEFERPGLDEIESVAAVEQLLDKPLITSKIISGDDIPDDEKQALQKNGDEVEGIEYHYESSRSLYLKYYNTVRSYNLSGVTVWRLGKGSEAIWKSLNEIFLQKGSSTRITLKIGNPNMEVNGTEKEIDPGRGTVPVIKNGRTLVPIRTVIESLGGQVEWNAALNLVTINYNSVEIKLTINSKKVMVNGINRDNDVAPEIINGRTYLPLRFLLENLGYKVGWDEQTRTVTIES